MRLPPSPSERLAAARVVGLRGWTLRKLGPLSTSVEIHPPGVASPFLWTKSKTRKLGRCSGCAASLFPGDVVYVPKTEGVAGAYAIRDRRLCYSCVEHLRLASRL